jgi:predicted transposase YbfD/YdcC
MKNSTPHTIRLQDGSLCNLHKRIVKQATPLLHFFAQIKDPRNKQGRRHALSLILTILFTALLRGSKDVKDAHLFALHNKKFFIKHFCLLHEIPDPTTISRVLQRVDPHDLIQAYRGFLTMLGISLGDVVSFDGKTIKAATGTETIRHMLSLFSHSSHAVLAQIGVTNKENEIPAFHRLLAQVQTIQDTTGMLFLGDALHTQKETVSAIIQAHADYVFVVKGNQKELFENILFAFQEEKLPSIYTGKILSRIPHQSYTYDQIGKKRAVTTTVTSTNDHDIQSYLQTTCGWEGVQTVGVLKRSGTRTSKDGTRTVIDEKICFISSRLLSAEAVSLHLRNHWCIENNLHWVKDVVFLEDKQTLRLGNAPQIMSFLRSMAISLCNILKLQSISDTIHNLDKNPTIHYQFLRMAAIV